MALCIVIGKVAATYPPTYCLALAALGAAIVVARWNTGVFAGALALLVLDGMPFINTKPSAVAGTGANIFADVAFLGLLAFLAVSALNRARNKRQDRIADIALIWAAGSLGWWAFKTFAASPGIPLVAAIAYGREFMYFPLLLPLALLGVRKRRDLIGFALTLALGAALFSVGQIATQLAHSQINWLVHVEKTAEIDGATRVYAPMTDLLLATFPMALAAALLGPTRWRRPAALLAALTGLALALSFTRAIYTSVPLAIVAVSVIWAAGRSERSRRIRWAFAVGLIAAVIVVAALGGSVSGTNTESASPFQVIATRVALGFSNVQEQSGTFGVRLRQTHLEIEVLDGHWLTGLGFLNPTYHYVAGLRDGSIRNSDLGSLNIVMTMGLIGLLLIYLPPTAGLIYLLRRRHGFVQYGGAMCLTVALVGSITLETLSSVQGLLVFGLVLALCVNWTSSEDSALSVSRPTRHERRPAAPSSRDREPNDCDAVHSRTLQRHTNPA